RHVVHDPGVVLGVLVEDILRWPGRLEAEIDRTGLTLCDHREAQRRRARGGRCGARQELAARGRLGFLGLLLAHQILQLESVGCGDSVLFFLHRASSRKRVAGWICSGASPPGLWRQSPRIVSPSTGEIKTEGACNSPLAARLDLRQESPGREVYLHASRMDRVEKGGFLQPTSIEAAKHLLVTVGAILLFGIASSLVSRKTKVPDVAVFLLVGIALGPGALGIVHIGAGSAANQLLLLFGSCYILFDGGASLRLRVLKEVWITIAVLATVGVIVTAAITAVAAQHLLGVPFITALLLGAAIASTDPATLVPIFRQVRVRERVAQTVMSESAFNDATGAIMTFAVLGVAVGTGEFSLSASLVDLARQSVIGIGAGAVLGYLAVVLIAHERIGFLAEHAPVVSLMAVIASFLAADQMQASGFMAVFVFGIVVG